MPSSSSDYTVLIDTREQTPWDFSKYHTHSCKLDTGDYSIVKGKLLEKYTDDKLEHYLCIERKKGAEELAANFVSDRFKNCIERIKQFKHKFMVVECPYESIMRFPYGSSIPRRKWRYMKIRGPFLMSCLASLSVDHGIHVIMAGNADNANRIAEDIIKRCIKERDNYES